VPWPPLPVRAFSPCGRARTWGLLSEPNISQEGFKAELQHKVQLDGKSHSVGIPGIVVESVFALEDPANSGILVSWTDNSWEDYVRPDAIGASWRPSGQTRQAKKTCPNVLLLSDAFRARFVIERWIAIATEKLWRQSPSGH